MCVFSGEQPNKGVGSESSVVGADTVAEEVPPQPRSACERYRAAIPLVALNGTQGVRVAGLPLGAAFLTLSQGLGRVGREALLPTIPHDAALMLLSAYTAGRIG